LYVFVKQVPVCLSYRLPDKTLSVCAAHFNIVISRLIKCTLTKAAANNCRGEPEPDIDLRRRVKKGGSKEKGVAGGTKRRTDNLRIGCRYKFRQVIL